MALAEAGWASSSRLARWHGPRAPGVVAQPGNRCAWQGRAAELFLTHEVSLLRIWTRLRGCKHDTSKNNSIDVNFFFSVKNPPQFIR